jgi:hypothetical protein
MRPADDTSFTDIIGDNGIILLEIPNPMGLEDAKQNLLDAINTTKNDFGGGLQPLSINGYFGCMGGNVMHTVTWDNWLVHYELVANLNVPLQRLVNIANSIPPE